MSLEHSPLRQKGSGRLSRQKGSLRADDDWPLLMRVREAAFELGVSTRRVYQLIHAGTLELVKIGKASRVTTASVLALAGKITAPGRLPDGMGGNTKARQQIHASK